MDEATATMAFIMLVRFASLNAVVSGYWWMTLTFQRQNPLFSHGWSNWKILEMIYWEMIILFLMSNVIMPVSNNYFAITD